MRTAYLEGRSIATLDRDHDVGRGAIRTAVADLLSEYTAVDPGAPSLELAVALDMPGKVADFLRAAELEPADLDICQVLDGTAALPAQRRARREYENRVNALLAASLRRADRPPHPPRSRTGGLAAFGLTSALLNLIG
ncbi:resolvase [Streptomyces cacaoi]